MCQAVDAQSPTLGFFVEWLREFGRQSERIHAIGLEAGAHDLPDNVVVHTLGKERGAAKFSQLLRLQTLLRTLLPEASGVFAHMSPEFAIAAWPQAALRKRPVVLWYSHRAVTLRLRLAAAMSRSVATTAGGSLNLPIPHAVRLGHGIPTDLFTPAAAHPSAPALLAVGRITPIKRVDLMIDAVAALRQRGIPATLTLVGAPATGADAACLAALRAHVDRLSLGSAVRFAGTTSYRALPDVYRSHAALLNLSPTGSPDKSVLEAMACGLPVVVANETFRPILGTDAAMMCVSPSPEDVARAIEAVLAADDPDLPSRMRAIVERDHSLERLIGRLTDLYA